jgi:ParB/RepB/Spo0J family partition protein
MARKPMPDLMSDILAAAPPDDRGAIVWLPLDQILDNPYQTRSSYSGIDLLAANILALRSELPATNGLQQIPTGRVVFMAGSELVAVDRAQYSQPALLRRQLLQQPGFSVQLHFGHRRLRAWQLLAASDPAYKEMPLMLAYADDLALWRHVVSENAQRSDINAIETALALRQAIDLFGLTLDDAGAPFGFVNRSTVSNKLRLLDLPADVRELVATGQLGERHARALLRLLPAPALLADLCDQHVKYGWTAAHMESQASTAIQQLPAIVKTAVDVPDAYSHRMVTVRPLWPLDWQPAPAASIRGACDGCQHLAQFSGESWLRCAAPDARAKTGCYQSKIAQWFDSERQRQATAAAAAIAASQAAPAVVDDAPGIASSELVASQAAPAVDDAPGIASSELVASQAAPAVVDDAPGIASSELVASQAAPAVDDAPGIASSELVASQMPASAGARVTADAVDQWATHWFGASYDAPRQLVDDGHCSADRCACFTIAYKDDISHDPDLLVRPDPDGAPHMCAACTNGNRLRARVRVASLDSEKRAEIARVNRDHDRAKALILAAVDAAGGFAAVLADPAFLAILAQRLGIKSTVPDPDWPKLIVMSTADQTCKMWSSITNGQTYDPRAAQSFADKIAHRQQPNPGDSQQLDWESGWSDDDTALWSDISRAMVDDATSSQPLPALLATYPLLTRRVVWRLIASRTSASERGELWRIANNLE